MISIPYGRQSINQADIDAVVAALSSDYLTQGPLVPNFEEKVANYCGVKYSVATNSATSALHIACLALDVGSGDIVWTSPITFVASANCALYCGAAIDFVDVDSQTGNMSVDRLSDKLIRAERDGVLPKVVVVVHLSGQSCDMKKIHHLSLRYGFRIIEDASHAIGGKYDGIAVGSCKYSDITIFSFHPVKIITTAEGGMAVTNSPEIARKMQLLRSHGITSQDDEMTEMPVNEIWNYQQITLGFNYRMTDVHAALGLSQLNRIDAFVEARNRIAENYDELLSGLPLRTPIVHSDAYSSFHLYVIRLNLNEIGKTQRQIYNDLRASSVLVNLHYIPVYRQPYYKEMGFQMGYCDEAEKYFSEAISLPIYPDLSCAEQEYVARVLSDLCKS